MAEAVAPAARGLAVSQAQAGGVGGAPPRCERRGRVFPRAQRGARAAPGHHVVLKQQDNKTNTTAFSALRLSAPVDRSSSEIMKFTHATTVQDQTLPPYSARFGRPRESQDGLGQDRGVPAPLDRDDDQSGPGGARRRFVLGALAGQRLARARSTRRPSRC